MDYNIQLKSKIKQNGLTQRSLAERIKEPESVVSLLINKRYVFPEQRLTSIKRKIAKALRVPQNEIF